MKRVALIGAGAAGCAAHFALKKLGIVESEVDIYSPHSNNRQNVNSEKKPLLKLGFEKLQVDERLRYRSRLKYGISGSSEIGGWSNYWGATLFRWPKSSFEEFDYINTSLDYFYDEALSLMKLNKSKGAKDSKGEDTSILSGFDFGSRLFSSLQRNIQTTAIFKFSKSNLAINERANDINSGCTNCGLCLSGCPGNHIWNSKKYFVQNNTVVIDGTVTKLIKQEDGYVLEFLNRSNETARSKNYHHVILALGSTQTACLLVESGFFDEIIIKQNDMKLIPFFVRGIPKIGGYTRVSLSEVFLWGQMPNSKNNFFMQCYGMNSEIQKKIKTQLGALGTFLSKGFGFILNRTGIAMLFLDSSASNSILVSKRRENQVTIEAYPNSTKRRVNLERIFQFRKNGIFFIWLLAKTTKTGESYHYGHSRFFRSGVEVEFDRELGEIVSLPGVVLVDSSSLPLLPSYPVTYTMMANALRLMSLKFKGKK